LINNTFFAIKFKFYSYELRAKVQKKLQIRGIFSPKFIIFGNNSHIFRFFLSHLRKKLLFCTRKQIMTMKVFNKIVDLQNELFMCRKEGKEIGLVPTMGALHEGHASLVKRSVKENGVTVVSVFLNPTQFNDQGDLDRYPRTLDADCKLLEACGADYVFAPSVKEMYPTPDTRHFEFPPVSTVMEGAKRPGHFNGVCQVVSRLFYIVRPTRAYFGEKDWQQIAVIKQLVKYINSDVQIVECPIIRDEDGLAKSSRNTLLAPDERAIAPNIYKALKESVEYAKTHTVQETHDKVVADINAVEGLEVEYFQIVDGDSLQDVSSWEDSAYVVGCITVYCGKTPIRLIDHIKYKG
jgi:pantoate--beta-alanine ligase